MDASIFTRKIGPVPVWGIGLAIILGLAYGVYSNRNAVAEPVAVDPSTDGDAVAEQSLNPVFLASPAPLQSQGVATVEVVNDMETWTRNAIAELVSTGKYGTSSATGLVQKYLNGDTLSFSERQDIDAMLAKVQLPPDIPVTGSTGAKPSGPAARQGTPPVSHTVRGSNDNTVSKLTVLYYSRSDADIINFVRAANGSVPSVRGNTAIPVGTRVYIPKYTTPKFYKATAAVNTAYAIAAKNGTSVARLQLLNPGMKFPVKAGTRVRVA